MVVSKMTLSKLFRKLRKKDRKDYRQFEGCLLFANLLVSSFFAVLFSPFIQETLPAGGDTRKIIYFIFGIAIVGCFIFVIYAAGLFLRQKSRQVGVFLALGTDRGKLARTMIGEVTYISICSTLIGIATGNILGLGIGKVFEKVSAIPGITDFQLSLTGLIPAFSFAFIVLLVLLVMTTSWIKRSNVMEIINEQRKSEPLKKEVSQKYLISGLVMLFLGLFIAVVLPNLYVAIFKQYISGVSNIFYLMSVWGLYRLLVYSIAVHKRGRNPQKYYRHLISYGMLKFQGISMVRNMILIALLIIGALYAAFYLPTNMTAGSNSVKRNPVDVSYNQLGNNSQSISEDQVVALAAKHNLTIKNYQEILFIELLSSTTLLEPDKSGKLVETYAKKGFYRQFTSVSEINEKFEKTIAVETGTYRTIRGSLTQESILSSYKDLDYVENTTTGVGKELKFAGTEVFDELLMGDGWDNQSRFILNDQDYEKLKAGISPVNQVSQVLFNVPKIEDSFEFSKELFKRYSESNNAEMRVMMYYDVYRDKNDEGYTTVDLQPDHPEAELDWKYAPFIKILSQKYNVLKMGVQFLLFAYVSIVMLASVGVISYTRSKSIGKQNQQVFEDLRKLGANNAYLIRCIKSQLQKVYLLPTVVGTLLVYLYNLLTYWQNDGVFSSFEIPAALICLVLCLLVALYQYVGYRISLREVARIVGITD